MSDACKHCDLRGKDRKLCTSDAGLGSFCSVPESWYAQEIRRENEELHTLAKSSIDNGDAIMAELVTAMKKCVELDKENAHLREEIAEWNVAVKIAQAGSICE
jgi:hypothetical protein